MFQYAGGVFTKFHDIPIEMQVGIIYAWSIEIPTDKLAWYIMLKPGERNLAENMRKLDHAFETLEAALS